jgi:excisionase family DNA binding protein
MRMPAVERNFDREPEMLLLRVEEAALCLGIGRTSMYRLVATGESVRIGGLRRIPMACRQDYVNRLRNNHESQAGRWR